MTIQVAHNGINITEEEVVKKLEKLNPHKSAGPDTLHPRVLKELAPVLGKPLQGILTYGTKGSSLPSSPGHAWLSASQMEGQPLAHTGYDSAFDPVGMRVHHGRARSQSALSGGACIKQMSIKGKRNRNRKCLSHSSNGG